jgi:hypothetical protein
MVKTALRTLLVVSALSFVYYIFGISLRRPRGIRTVNRQVPITGNYCTSEVWAQQGFWERKPGVAYVFETKLADLDNI